MAKKRNKQPSHSHPDNMSSESQFLHNQLAYNQQDRERGIAAISATKNAEIERVLSRLRLLRSCLPKETQQTPILSFLKQSCPNILPVKDAQYPVYGVVKRNFDNSFCEREMAGPDLNFSHSSVRTSFLNAARLQIQGFVLDEASESQFPGLQTEAFLTPGAMRSTGGRQTSVGVTPKSQRLPKPGEMLLSAQGSPLGVYHGKSLEAICESEDCSDYKA